MNSQTIPAWLVALAMVLTGLSWLITRNRTIRLDSRIFAYTYIVEGLIYGFVFQTFSIDTEIRGFFSRLMIVVLSLAQLIPLFVSYLRSKEDE